MGRNSSTIPAVPPAQRHRYEQAPVPSTAAEGPGVEADPIAPTPEDGTGTGDPARDVASRSRDRLCRGSTRLPGGQWAGARRGDTQPQEGRRMEQAQGPALHLG